MAWRRDSVCVCVGGDDRDHEIEKGGIHARKHFLKEKEAGTEDLRRSGSGEKGMWPGKPKTRR